MSTEQTHETGMSTSEPEALFDLTRAERRERYLAEQRAAEAAKVAPKQRESVGLAQALRGQGRMTLDQWWVKPDLTSARQRSKVSGAELMARREQRRAGSAREGTRISARAVGLMVGLGLGTAALVGLWVNDNLADAEHYKQMQSLSVATAEAEHTRDDLEAQVQARTWVAEMDPVALRTSTLKAARRVAGDQDRYAELYAADRGRVGNGAPSKAALEAVEHRSTLTKHFAPSALVLDEDTLGRFSTTTETEIGQGTFDPRLPWFIRYDSQGAMPAGTYGWSVDSVAALDGTSEARFRVVWTSRAQSTQASGSGEVLAWVVGTYDVGTEKFDDLRLTLTNAGAGASEQGVVVETALDGKAVSEQSVARTKKQTQGRAKP